MASGGRPWQATGGPWQARLVGNGKCGYDKRFRPTGAARLMAFPGIRPSSNVRAKIASFTLELICSLIVTRFPANNCLPMPVLSTLTLNRYLSLQLCQNKHCEKLASMSSHFVNHLFVTNTHSAKASFLLTSFFSLRY